jgi:hypothetical protein
MQNENNVAKRGDNITKVVLSPTGKHSTERNENITPPYPNILLRVSIKVVHQLLPHIPTGLLLLLLLEWLLL